MCGPLVASYALASPSRSATFSFGTLAPHLLYNTGRILTYGLIGAVMGLSGSFVNVAGRLAGFQNIVAIAAGLIMIIMGLSITGISGSTAWLERYNSAVIKMAHRVLASTSIFRYFPLGLLLGLLPCGLSYTVFIASAGTGGPFPGMLTALLFGLGTLPSLLFFGVLVTALNSRLRNRIYRAGGVVVMIMGFYFLLRGIKLYAGL
jgi:sulfite exporter TauE/SafE